MKTNRKLAIVVSSSTLALALTAGLMLPASASSGASTTSTRYINLSSTGTVKVTPDAVRLDFTVSLLAPTSKAALAGVASSASAVRTAIAKGGVQSEYIKTQSINVYPDYTYNNNNTAPTLNGYRASQSFDVVIRNAKSAGVIVDSVVNAGGDNVQVGGVSPFIYDESLGVNKAIAMAISKAKAKAALYAKLLGVRLGSVQSLDENAAPINYPVYYAGMAKADAGAPATQVDLGQQDISVTVNVRWGIN
jgi:uncharacterized protein YggE